MRRFVCLLLVAGAIVAVGCRLRPSSTPPDDGSALRTTDGAIAMANLDAQLDGERRLARFAPLSTTQQAGIVGLLLMRGQFRGAIADYEEAAALADALVRQAPADARAYLARAQARATFHRFHAALADLRRAQRLHGSARQIAAARGAIVEAVGRYDEALAFRQWVAQVDPDIRTLGAEAVLRGERGELDRADALFASALTTYHDVSPFPVAWLEFQQGQMWMREGQFARARDLFVAAHRRLPAYAAAQGHLGEAEAALGHFERAVALLRPLAQRADDPDYAAQLARVLALSGSLREAARWRACAARRYRELVAKHPAAFADHAAEFWLAQGNGQRALLFARANVALRPTPRAYELLLDAGLAAGVDDDTCAAAVQVQWLPHLWPHLHASAELARPRCAAAALPIAG